MWFCWWMPWNLSWLSSGQQRSLVISIWHPWWVWWPLGLLCYQRHHDITWERVYNEHDTPRIQSLWQLWSAHKKYKSARNPPVNQNWCSWKHVPNIHQEKFSHADTLTCCYICGKCHELWLRNFGSTWLWEGHMTKPGLTHHVTHHVTDHMTQHLTLHLNSHVTKNESMTWCTPISVGVIYVTSTTDTRTCETMKLFKIGSALTPTRVNATWSQTRRQCTLMGISDTQRGSWGRESCAIG